LNNLIEKGFRPRGLVVDLGCGRGGWSQRVAMEPELRMIEAFTLGGMARENPQPFLTKGHNLINFRTGVNVHDVQPFKVDTLMCDIGESDANHVVEASRSLKVLDTFENWVRVSPFSSFVIKVLNPYDHAVLRRLARLQIEFGGQLVRSPYSRNSSAELYYVSGERRSLLTAINGTLLVLLKRFADDKPTRKDKPPVLETGTRKAEKDLQDIDLTLVH